MPEEALRQRAQAPGLFGLLTEWEAYAEEPWLPHLLEIEENERRRRSLERRIKDARIGRFKPMADFDWNWPERVDRDLLDDLFTFGFLAEGAQAVILGPNGVGKTTIAQNLAHQAVLKGHTVRFAAWALATLLEALGELTERGRVAEVEGGLQLRP